LRPKLRAQYRRIAPARAILRAVGRPKNTVSTEAVSWHLASSVTEAVRHAAAELGVGPGVIVTRVLEQEIAQRG